MMKSKLLNFVDIDVTEQEILDLLDDVMDILLIDRTNSTKSKITNIIWANNNYIKYGRNDFSEKAQILPSRINKDLGELIKPRALKAKDIKFTRTKDRAEVFTPTQIVKSQNDEVDLMYKNDDFLTYISRKWLEVTCGEAPYMTSRYDMETGELIQVENRVGFVDRKLRRINSYIKYNHLKWHENAIDSYKASYGFELNGDSLFLARLNLVLTYIENYYKTFDMIPSIENVVEIATIISYNVFQMDGVTFTIPFSETKKKVRHIQISLFDDIDDEVAEEVIPGKKVMIMNWETNKMEQFDKLGE